MPGISRHVIGMLALLACLIGVAAGAENRRAFDLPADTADRSLQRLSLQSGLQVMFAADVTNGVMANAVKGEFTPFEAARRLFAGTALRVSYNDKTGVLSVTRAPAEDRGRSKKKATVTPASGRQLAEPPRTPLVHPRNLCIARTPSSSWLRGWAS